MAQPYYQCIYKIVDVLSEDLEENMFGMGASIEEFSFVFVARELSLLKRYILQSICVDLLVWCTSMRVSFQMLTSLPNKSLEY